MCPEVGQFPPRLSCRWRLRRLRRLPRPAGHRPTLAKVLAVVPREIKQKGKIEGVREEATETCRLADGTARNKKEAPILPTSV